MSSVTPGSVIVGRRSAAFNGSTDEAPIDSSYASVSGSKVALTSAGQTATILDVEGQGEIDVLTSRTVSSAAVARVTITVDGLVSFHDTDGVSASTFVLIEPRSSSNYKSPSIKFNKSLKIEVDHSAGSADHRCEYRYWVS